MPNRICLTTVAGLSYHRHWRPRPAMLVLVLIMGIDGFILGRKANRMVDAKFPDNTESGWKLGFYAASRASQLRRMRAPRPQVERGNKVT